MQFSAVHTNPQILKWMSNLVIVVEREFVGFWLNRLTTKSKHPANSQKHC